MIHSHEVAILGSMVAASPKRRLTKAQIMGLSFILQVAGLETRYQFKLFNFGPYDDEVLQDASYAVSRGFLARGEDGAFYPGTKIAPIYQYRIKALMEAFGELSGGEIGLASTVIFVHKAIFQRTVWRYDGDSIADAILKISPSASRPKIVGYVRKFLASFFNMLVQMVEPILIENGLFDNPDPVDKGLANHILSMPDGIADASQEHGMNEWVNEWMDEARMIAAKCWCDKETQDRVMDPALAEAFARRLATRMSNAAQNMRNSELYFGLLRNCAEHLGKEAFTDDSGVVHESPICQKIPELVKDAVEKLKTISGGEHDKA